MFGTGFGGRLSRLMSSTDGKVEADKQEKKLLSKETIFTLDGDGASIVEMGGRSDVVTIAKDFTDQKAKIEEYRTIARMPDVDKAITEIVNDAVACDEDEDIVSLILDDCEDISDKTKELIREEFDVVLRLLNFNDKSYTHFKRWFIDGRAYVHCVVDEGSLRKGIQKAVFLDPRCTRAVEKRRIEVDSNGIETIREVDRVVIYNPGILNSKERRSHHGVSYRQTTAVELPEDVVAYSLHDERDEYGMQVGHLDPVLKPANDLRNLEDAAVIYRLVNAPERRVYYIDTGNLPKKSAEELIRKVRNKFRTKITYDSSSGRVQSETRHMAMTDAIWLPRREGSTGTEVDTLQGGQNLGDIEDIIYFRKKLQAAMHVPLGRMESDSMINIGGTDDTLTHEELKFHNLIVRYRTEFNAILKGVLKRQLILKRITTKQDWDQLIEPFLKFNYAAESAMKSQIESQKILDRVGSLSEIEPYIGSIFSRKYVLTKILHMTEDDMEQMQKEIAEEEKAGLYPRPDEDGEFGMDETALKRSGNGLTAEWAR